MTHPIKPAREPMTYADIILKAAEDIERCLRTGRETHVYAWPSLSGQSATHEDPPCFAPGVIIAVTGEGVPSDPYAPRKDHPIYVRPVTARCWGDVPFGDLYGQIWAMCRHIPILGWKDPT